MANEILEMVNHDDNVTLFTATSVYRKHSGSTAATLFEIGQPIYQGVATGPTSKLMAFGDYTGTDTLVAVVKVLSATSFAYSLDNGITYGPETTITRDGLSIGLGLQVQFYATEGFTTNDTWRFSVAQAFSDSRADTYDKWAVKQYNDGFFFINIQNSLRYVEGGTVRRFIASDETNPPKAVHMEIFHGHVVLGNVIADGFLSPRRVMWTDIHDFSQFTPDPTNEADFYDITIDEELQEQVFGVTGVKKLGINCYVYGPKSIYRMTYIGLPKVMQLLEIVSGVGNCFPYSLIGYNQIHAFISDENFYVFEGDMPKAVGDPIKDYFFETLTLDVNFRYRTWAFHHRTFNEICWVYVSTASSQGKFDKAVIWNYREDVWYTADVENIHSFCLASIIGVTGTIDDDHEMIESVHELINDRGSSLELVRLALYGTADGVILREEVSTDALNDLVYRTVPQLVTKDFTYGSIQKLKEIDTISIDASYGADCSGIDVYVSTRNSYGDAVVFNKVGTWTPTLFEGRLSFPRVAGKIFRYAFQPLETNSGKAVRTVNFAAWGENVRGAVPKEQMEK